MWVYVSYYVASCQPWSQRWWANLKCQSLRVSEICWCNLAILWFNLCRLLEPFNLFLNLRCSNFRLRCSWFKKRGLSTSSPSLVAKNLSRPKRTPVNLLRRCNGSPLATFKIVSERSANQNLKLNFPHTYLLQSLETLIYEGIQRLDPGAVPM